MRKILIALAFLVPAFAIAAPGTVGNPGFELPGLGDGGVTFAPPLPWTANLVAGILDPLSAPPPPGEFTPGSPLAPPAGGVQASFADGAGASMCQDVGGSSIEDGATYDLSVVVGWRDDIGGPPVYRIELRTAVPDGNALLVSETSPSVTSPLPLQGAWVTATAQYIGTMTTDGLGLRICLVNENAVTQTNFDEVELTETLLPVTGGVSVPTLGEWGMVLLGAVLAIAGVLGSRVRKQI